MNHTNKCFYFFQKKNQMCFIIHDLPKMKQRVGYIFPHCCMWLNKLLDDYTEKTNEKAKNMRIRKDFYLVEWPVYELNGQFG